MRGGHSSGKSGAWWVLVSIWCIQQRHHGQWPARSLGRRPQPSSESSEEPSRHQNPYKNAISAIRCSSSCDWWCSCNRCWEYYALIRYRKARLKDQRSVHPLAFVLGLRDCLHPGAYIEWQCFGIDKHHKSWPFFEFYKYILHVYWHAPRNWGGPRVNESTTCFSSLVFVSS